MVKLFTRWQFTVAWKLFILKHNIKSSIKGCTIIMEMENIKHHSLLIKSVQSKICKCKPNLFFVKFHFFGSPFNLFCYHQLVTFIVSVWYLYWFYITLSFTSCKLILFFKTFNFWENPSSSLSITIRPGHLIFHGKINTKNP